MIVCPYILKDWEYTHIVALAALIAFINASTFSQVHLDRRNSPHHDADRILVGCAAGWKEYLSELSPSAPAATQQELCVCGDAGDL